MRKRGAPSSGQYRTTGRTAVSADFDSLCARRTAPFLDSVGLDTRPLSFLLKEAYRQGIIDAAEAMQQRTDQLQQ